jgi:hypothetical protein
MEAAKRLAFALSFLPQKIMVNLAKNDNLRVVSGSNGNNEQSSTTPAYTAGSNSKLSTMDETKNVKPAAFGDKPVSTNTSPNNDNPQQMINSGLMDKDLNSFLKLKGHILSLGETPHPEDDLSNLSIKVSKSPKLTQRYLDHLWQIVKNASLEPKAAVNNDLYNIPLSQNDEPKIVTKTRGDKFQIPLKKPSINTPQLCRSLIPGASY